MALRKPDSTHGPFPERTTRQFTGTIKDELDAAIPGASLTTCTYTLYTEHDDPTLTIINSRNDVDCKSNVSALGVLTLILTPADMQILVPTLEVERHRLLIEWSYNGGKEGAHEAQIRVSSMAKRP